MNDYWPLQVGNRWVYEYSSVIVDEAVSQEQFVLEVLSEAEIEGEELFSPEQRSIAAEG